MPAHSAPKTRVNALVSRASTSLLLVKDVDGRDKPGHDDRKSRARLRPLICSRATAMLLLIINVRNAWDFLLAMARRRGQPQRD